MVDLGAIYSLCVSVCLFVCTLFLKLHTALEESSVT